jgi:DNA-binding XRE family transcriptional regulator
VRKTLKEIRAKYGMTVEHAANAIGIHMDDLLDYEEGQKSPTYYVAQAISLFYGLTFDDVEWTVKEVCA